MKKIPAAILGATGSVGQRFVQLLDQHPWFDVVCLTGSERTIGTRYGETCRWLLTDPMPEWAKDIVVSPTDPAKVDQPLVFSALPTDIAKTVEADFAAKGSMVCSNASAFRMADDVPILIPEANAEHAKLVEVQRSQRGWKGGIVTNSNCTSTGITVAFKAMLDAFGIDKAFVVSMQALSGAGFPGVPSMDVIDNLIPFIGGEEHKVQTEPLKMLGTINGNKIDFADFPISAHTNRVGITDGHTVCASLALKKKPSVAEAIEAIRSYQAPEICRDLPSTPRPVLLYRNEDNRPQPRMDRMTGKGMTTVVGRLREDPIFDVKMVICSHNTIRGAAGGSVYNAELLTKMGYLS
ncbi:MAG: aspartate-semialdehyde dehydrogenase [Anaerolineaceae bacterium]|nr:aspartate-semialdehyde dehydrogenase [Anaerolineaceae bacterium]